MILTVKNIDEIIVTDIDGAEVTVKKGDKFETSEKTGQSYLNSYPQFFKTASELVSEEVQEEVDDGPTVAELTELIKGLGGKPSGKKLQLVEQYNKLLADKEQADADAKKQAELDAQSEAKAKELADAQATTTTP